MYTVIFFGSSQHSARVLEALRSDGRYNIKLAADGDLTGDVGVVVDYGRLISTAEIDRFPYGIINLHPSLLPAHRGAIPAVSTILAGDKVTGVTLIKINEQFDQGEIIAQETSEVLPDDTPPVLYDRLFDKGINLLLRVLPEYLTGNVSLKPQGPAVGPSEKRLTKASGRIDWSQSDEYLERFIRAMHPWPGSWTTLDEIKKYYLNPSLRNQPKQDLHGLDTDFHRFKNPNIRDNPYQIREDPSEKSVKIRKARLNTLNQLEILQLQLEGKKPMTWKEFENGYLS